MERLYNLQLFWWRKLFQNFFSGKNVQNPKKRRGLQNLRWVPFFIHVGVDNKDEARLSTSWSTRDSFRRLAPHVQPCKLKLVMNKSRSWCPCCKGLGCRKAGEMLLNVQCGHMELLLLRKTTCFLILYIYISCGGGHENLKKILMRKVSWTPRTGDFDGEVYRYKAFAFIRIMIICVLSKTQPTLNMLF